MAWPFYLILLLFTVGAMLSRRGEQRTSIVLVILVFALLFVFGGMRNVGRGIWLDEPFESQVAAMTPEARLAWQLGARAVSERLENALPFLASLLLSLAAIAAFSLPNRPRKPPAPDPTSTPK